MQLVDDVHVINGGVYIVHKLGSSEDPSMSQTAGRGAKPAPRDTKPASRDTYRHGDLRNALVEAGYALARAGGPEAVVLREATRQAGVVPNAAYRHFASRDDLLRAVRDRALRALATAIERELAALDPMMKRKAFARASLRAVGLGYLAFAMAEPGLFRTAFTPPGVPAPTPPAADAPPCAAPGGPFDLLGIALDRMVAADLMPPHRRSGAEYLAWSAVHGLATLINDGPLGALDPELRGDLGERLVRLVERGL